MELELERIRLRLRRTLRITLAWLGIGLVSALFEVNVLWEHGRDGSLRQTLDHHFWIFSLAGLIGGGVYIFVLRDRLRKLPFLRAFGLMAGIMLLIIFLTHIVVPHVRGIVGSIEERLFSVPFLAQYLFWTLLMGATMLMVRINDQYSSGGITYLAGRYHRPRSELRVFMFLDMRSSTAIAEELGHVKYCKLLNEVYADITDPVIDSRGEIYQYVGDEMSVSWPLRKGIKRQRCVSCFFRIRKKLRARAEHYRKNYGLVPTFKAGIHYGEVTTGEVGLVKKELIFSGDAVNTAARIQNSCNTFGVDILISQELLEMLHLTDDRYERREIGEIELKGKKNAVSLWTIEQR